MRNPGTSFHSVTSFAPSARAVTVAVRSEPPRPSVTTKDSPLPASVTPRAIKPGTTTISPARNLSGKIFCAAISVRAISGAASPNRPSECKNSVASTTQAEIFATRNASATIRAAKRSPREIIKSPICAVSSPACNTCSASFLSSLNDSSIYVSVTAAAPSIDFATDMCRSKRASACA